jgi:prepilin-type N-terminal cleavage/methylation domain-containing protein
MKSTRVSSHRAFTLIELLVVITIVAILAGLSFPAIGGALNKARETEKLSNLRQIYIASTLYSGEHNGRALPAQDAREDIDGGTPSWRDLLAPYVYREDATKPEVKKQEVFIDPFFTAYDPNLQSGSRTGYAINVRPGLPENNEQNAVWNVGQAFGHDFRVFTITHPTHRVLIGDSDTAWFFNTSEKAPEEALTATRHGKGDKGMFLMFAGNIEKLTLDEAVLAATDPEALKQGAPPN